MGFINEYLNDFRVFLKRKFENCCWRVIWIKDVQKYKEFFGISKALTKTSPILAPRTRFYKWPPKWPFSKLFKSFNKTHEKKQIKKTTRKSSRNQRISPKTLLIWISLSSMWYEIEIGVESFFFLRFHFDKSR